MQPGKWAGYLSTSKHDIVLDLVIVGMRWSTVVFRKQSSTHESRREVVNSQRTFFFPYFVILTDSACPLWTYRSPRSLGRFCSYLERFQGLEGENGFCTQKGSFLTWISQIPDLPAPDLVKMNWLQTDITLSTDVAAWQDYMFLKRARWDLFKNI